jgi:hypothetical protein
MGTQYLQQALEAGNFNPIGQRIEIPVHYDMWMRGARFGEITAFRHGKPGQSDHYLIKMDHPQIRRRLKLWRGDWEFAKVLP